MYACAIMEKKKTVLENSVFMKKKKNHLWGMYKTV